MNEFTCIPKLKKLPSDLHNILYNASHKMEVQHGAVDMLREVLSARTAPVTSGLRILVELIPASSLAREEVRILKPQGNGLEGPCRYGQIVLFPTDVKLAIMERLCEDTSAIKALPWKQNP